MKIKTIIWLVIIALAVVLAFTYFNGDDSSDNSAGTNNGAQGDEIPSEDLSDLSSDDEVFNSIDEGIENL